MKGVQVLQGLLPEFVVSHWTRARAGAGSR
jgi:hypothetical protein